jgi:hypothetical protein
MSIEQESSAAVKSKMELLPSIGWWAKSWGKSRVFWIVDKCRRWPTESKLPTIRRGAAIRPLTESGPVSHARAGVVQEIWASAVFSLPVGFSIEAAVS